MRTRKNGLDEMQRELRNRVGHQMFMIMAYALMVNCGLYGFGVRWLSYPADVMVILMVCLGIYLVRLIAANAYLPQKTPARKPVMGLIAAKVGAAALAFALIKLLAPTAAPAPAPAGDYSAYILVIVSAVALIAALITALIKRADNREDGE